MSTFLKIYQGECSLEVGVNSNCNGETGFEFKIENGQENEYFAINITPDDFDQLIKFLSAKREKIERHL